MTFCAGSFRPFFIVYGEFLHGPFMYNQSFHLIEITKFIYNKGKMWEDSLCCKVLKRFFFPKGELMKIEQNEEYFKKACTVLNTLYFNFWSFFIKKEEKEQQK